MRRSRDALVGAIEARDRLSDGAIHVTNGLQDALAEIARFVAVAQLDGLMLTGGRAGRDRGAAHGATFEDDVRFHRGIAARIENLSAADPRDFGGHAASREKVKSFESTDAHE